MNNLIRNLLGALGRFTTPTFALLALGFAATARADVTIAVNENPTFQDYTNATVVATITSTDFDEATASYKATVGGTAYEGVYAQATHKVTFNIAGTSGSQATAVITATAAGSATPAATTSISFVFGDATNWFSETAETKGGTGTWSDNVTTAGGMIVFELEDDAQATFAPNDTMYGKVADVVTVFETGAPNDDGAPEANSQFAVRIASADAGYKFQVWEGGAATPAWVDVTAGSVVPAMDTAYTLVMRFDYAERTVSAGIVVDGVTNALTAANARTAFALPGANKSLASFAFYGSGKLASMSGSYFDNTLFIDTNGVHYTSIEDVPTNTVVVVPGTASGVTVEPGKKAYVAEDFGVEKVKVSYKGKSLAQYVEPKLVAKEISGVGTVNEVQLNVTDAAKPTVTQIQMPGADGVKLGIAQPIAGLFYGLVEAGSIGGLGDATAIEKKQYTGEGALDLQPGTAPTSGDNVKYYRVRVTAE